MSRRYVPFLIPVLLVLLGSVGYWWIEGWPWLDAIFMTVITLTTVGFGEVHPLSPGGRLFTVSLILVGVGTLAYAFARISEAVLDPGLFARRRMQMDIKGMRDHVIVCGFGRMGSTVVEELADRGIAHVVVERDPERLRDLELRRSVHLAGDATDDAVLIEAGAPRARSLATVLPHDADNLFVTLTARRLNPKLTIIARSSSPKNDPKLLSAGATRVLNPYLHAGRLLARQLLQPAVTDFMEVLSRREDAPVEIEEVRIETTSPLAGKSLRGSGIRQSTEVMILAVRSAGMTLTLNPPADTVLRAGDTVVAVGSRGSLKKLADLAASHEA